MAARFRLNYSGVGELLRSPGMRAEMLRRAEAIRAEAVGIAPVGGANDPHPGYYKASFKVDSKITTARGGRRVVATVTNTAYYAAHVEYGAEGGKGGAHHVLLRAALAAGGGP